MRLKRERGKQSREGEGERRLELELEVDKLRWNLNDGTISYGFRVFIPSGGYTTLALNRGLKVKQLSEVTSYKVRQAVEADLHWATLTFVSFKGGSGRVSGFIEGSPEDFTLSRLGVRYGRVVLSGELVWHPVLGRGLVTWGTRGHIKRYVVHVATKLSNVSGPGEAVEMEDGVSFTGQPRLRNPGISIVGGVTSWEREGVRTASINPIEAGAQDALTALHTINQALSKAGERLGVPVPDYRVLTIVWDDLEPFASDDMLTVRLSVAKALTRGASVALFETIYTASVHTVYNVPLESIWNYWLYEALPGALSLYILAISRGREAVNAAVQRFAECVKAAGGQQKLPTPASVAIPKNPRQHASVSCLAPLIMWGILGSRDVDALGALLSCMLSSPAISVSTLEGCAAERLGASSGEFFEALRKRRGVTLGGI